MPGYCYRDIYRKEVVEVMTKKILIVAVCIGIVTLLLGTAFSFSNAKTAIEGVEDTSNTLLFDVSSISLFAFVCSDYFSGADSFNITQAYYEDGSMEIIYQSFDRYEQNGLFEYETIRLEKFPIFQEGEYPTEKERDRAWKRIYVPIEPFLGDKPLFDTELGSILGHIRYILGMIWGTLSIIVLILIDTVAVAWELIRVGLAFVSLA